ncbi:MAG TPA: type IX secretion system membrane protein PorP/SprF [Flavobacterium sp.]|nr:type IX secretion system membrane protein PorP/SprF [Flavobacterium sp.]
MKLNIKVKKAYFLLIGLIAIAVNAQQDPQYTQYMYNTMTVNSAYAGSTGALEATLLHRSQWTGLDGAPQTQSLTIDAPIGSNVGLGFSAVNDKLGPSSEIYLEGNFSYTVNLNHDMKLAFGVKAGIRSLDVDWSKGRYYDNTDVLLNNNIESKIKPSFGAGLYLYKEKWYAGISVPSFLRADYYDDVKEALLSDRLHYYFIGGYVFDLSDNLKFKPAAMAKLVSGAPITVDLSANFLIQEKLTLGASYRFDDSMSALVGFQITKSLYAGYAFDYTVTDLNKYNNGSHEIILRFQMPQKSSQIKSPRFF